MSVPLGTAVDASLSEERGAEQSARATGGLLNVTRFRGQLRYPTQERAVFLQDAEKGSGVAGTIPVLAQRAACEGPRWTRAVGIIPATPQLSERSSRLR